LFFAAGCCIDLFGLEYFYEKGRTLRAHFKRSERDATWEFDANRACEEEEEDEMEGE
jgi:hypothetical protein